jgi:CO/xanthine dehydrogenase FAD-binding subunit
MKIIEYHRPNSIDEALQLLSRPEPLTVPLGGGSAIREMFPRPVAVVDLQALGFDQVERQGNRLDIGARVALEDLMKFPAIMPALRQAIELEAAHNQRQAATAAGALVSAGGRSPFATAMLALDAQITLKPGEDGASEEIVSLGDLLLQRGEMLPGRLITEIKIPLNVRMCFDSVARTPADRPIVCAAAVQWSGGRTRIALGGYGNAPILAMDGPEATGAEIAAREAYCQAGDVWASAEYRQEVAGVLARRCVESFVIE